MKLGISSYALTWAIGVEGYPVPDNPLNLAGIIQKAISMDVRLLQIADNVPLHTKEPEELQHAKSLLEKNAIDIEVGTRGISPYHMLNYLEIAKFFNSKIVRTIVDTYDMDFAASQLNKILPEYNESGVQIAIENHDGHKIAELIYLIEALDNPNVGICLDTVNSFGALEAPDQVISELAPHVLNLHIKDFEITRQDHKMGFILAGTPAGKGQLNISWILDEMKQHNRSPNLILELWTPYQHDIEKTIGMENQWLQESIRYLKTYKF